MFLNQFKTVLLLGALAGVLLLVGWLIGGLTGLTIGLALAVCINFVSYWFSDKIVLMMYRAKKLKEEDAPGLHAVVEEIAKEAGIPKPRVYLIPSDNANAFATGRNYKNAVVGVTAGILKILSTSELKGVIAHEISHIKNKDILIQTIAATIAAVISYVAFMARFAAIFGGVRGRSGGEMFQLLALAILTPIIALIIRLAISRSREYLADERGAKLIGDGEPLASALLKLEENKKYHPLRFGNKTTASLFITNPFKGGGIFSLFSTHPPITKRVEKLRSMKI
jgi:heat shock protein HtpX